MQIIAQPPLARLISRYSRRVLALCRRCWIEICFLGTCKGLIEPARFIIVILVAIDEGLPVGCLLFFALNFSFRPLARGEKADRRGRQTDRQTARELQRVDKATSRVQITRGEKTSGFSCVLVVRVAPDIWLAWRYEWRRWRRCRRWA